MEMNVNRELVKELRRRKSWSQEKLADEARVSLRTVQRIESDGAASLQSRSAIASAFEVEPIELDVERVAPERFGTQITRQVRMSSVAALQCIGEVFRGISIFFASLFGALLYAMAVFKAFLPANIGLFTSETSMSFGIIGNTSSMQEHLGYWVIPLVITAGFMLIKCALVLMRAKVR